jgi:Zn-dependent protease
MLERLKRALVNSFVGAIALGWLFAQAFLHFAYVFSAPLAGWLARREYHGMLGAGTVPTGFSLQDALPELVKSVSLLLLGYFLLRWLYYKPIEPETTVSRTEEST